MSISNPKKMTGLWVKSFEEVTKDKMPEGGVIIIKIGPGHVYVACSSEIATELVKTYGSHSLKVNKFTSFYFYVTSDDDLKLILKGAGFGLNFLNPSTLG